MWGARHLAGARARRSTPTRCSPAPGSRTSPRGSASRRPGPLGATCSSTAEIGLWGYDPVPGDPFVLNHRNFWRSTMLGDASLVLGALVGGTGTTTLACLGGAQVDRHGNINSTAASATAVPRRLGRRQRRRVGLRRSGRRRARSAPSARQPTCEYITSPGPGRPGARHRPRHPRPRHDGELVLTAVPAGPEPLAARIAAARAACGWDLAVAERSPSSAAPTPDELASAADLGPPGLVPPDPLTGTSPAVSLGRCLPAVQRLRWTRHTRPIGCAATGNGVRGSRRQVSRSRPRGHHEALRRCRRRRRPDPDRRRPGAARPPRPVRVRQVDGAAHHRRSRGAHRGHDPHRRPRRHRHRSQGPRPRDGLPVLRPVPAHERRTEHRVPAARPGVPSRAGDPSSRRRPASSASRVPGPQAGQLSGGQRQRVALARAIVRRPRRSSWTSRSRTSTPSCACRPAPSSSSCSVASRRR